VSTSHNGGSPIDDLSDRSRGNAAQPATSYFMASDELQRWLFQAPFELPKLPPCASRATHLQHLSLERLLAPLFIQRALFLPRHPSLTWQNSHTLLSMPAHPVYRLPIAARLFHFRLSAVKACWSRLPTIILVSDFTKTLWVLFHGPMPFRITMRMILQTISGSAPSRALACPVHLILMGQIYQL
jgi:hypothetical protein